MNLGTWIAVGIGIGAAVFVIHITTP